MPTRARLYRLASEEVASSSRRSPESLIAIHAHPGREFHCTRYDRSPAYLLGRDARRVDVRGCAPLAPVGHGRFQRTVIVPMHRELAPGTFGSILKLAGLQQRATARPPRIIVRSAAQPSSDVECRITIAIGSLRSRPAGARHVDIDGVHQPRPRCIRAPTGGWKLCGHDQQRLSVRPAEHAGEAAAIDLDALEHLAAFANAHAALGPHIRVPNGTLERPSRSIRVITR